jgi:3-oxoacyl-[acyl-carrier protein] reductase
MSACGPHHCCQHERPVGKPILNSIPLRRLGTPEDIAEVVAFLATVTPNFMTGEVIDVDGGQWVN